MKRLKVLWLKMRKRIRRFLNWLYYKISYFLFIFSFILFLAILIPNILGKLPVFSYFYYEHQFPMTYELCGTVNLINEDGDLLIDEDIEIFIGGYKTYASSSSEFNLKFSTPATDEVLIIVRYNSYGIENENIISLKIDGHSHIIHEVFNIYV